jgi:hypothetical protein
MSEADWCGRHLTEDEIVADLVARLRAEPKALRSWMNSGPEIHFTAGMMVRNWYGLWREDCPLTKADDGDIFPPHPDDVSGRIIDHVLKALADEAAGKPKNSKKPKKAC